MLQLSPSSQSKMISSSDTEMYWLEQDLADAKVMPRYTVGEEEETEKKEQAAQLEKKINDIKEVKFYSGHPGKFIYFSNL